MASPPIGTMSDGFRIATSRSRNVPQRSTSSASGLRSPPPFALPGKHRATALKYTCSRTAFSSRSRAPSSQRKSVFPAVHAKGRPSLPSCGPGACPMSSTRLTTGGPCTTGPIMFGQRAQASSSSWSSVSFRFDVTRLAYRVLARSSRAPGSNVGRVCSRRSAV